MKVIDFPESNFVFAKDQLEYLQLPAYVDEKSIIAGRVVCCWHLSLKERVLILFKGIIWQEMLTFKHPVQPQRLTVKKPFFW